MGQGRVTVPSTYTHYLGSPVSGGSEVGYQGEGGYLCVSASSIALR